MYGNRRKAISKSTNKKNRSTKNRVRHAVVNVKNKQQITHFIYSDLDFFDDVEDMLLIYQKIDGKEHCGVIHAKKGIIIPPQYKSIEKIKGGFLAEPFEGKKIKLDENGKIPKPKRKKKNFKLPHTRTELAQN